MDPVLFTAFGIEIRWYSILILVGIILAIGMLIKEGKRFNIPKDFLFNMAFWVIIFGIIVLLFLIMMVYAFTVVIKNTLKDKKEKHSKFGEVEKKNPGIKPIPGMDYHNNDNDDFNINPKDYK